MALDKDRLAAAILVIADAKGFTSSHALSKLPDFADAIAEAVVTEIQANAQVTTTVAGGSSAGAHPGIIL